METVLIFLAKAIASGAIGHYVSRGLGKIDKDLPLLLEKNADIKAIERLVTDKGIETQVIEFANRTFDNSIVLPTLSSESITNKDKTELFLNFIKIGMELSHRLKMDLLLPSSFVSQRSFTLFTRNSEGTPSLKSAGVAIDLKAGVTTISNNLYIVPVASENDKKEVWYEYLENLSELREETEKYLNIEETSGSIAECMGNCDINIITAGACYFKYALLMDDKIKEQLQISGAKSKSTYWFEAIKEMTDGMNEIMDGQVLPSAEVEKIREAYAHIQDILETHIK